MPTHRYCASCLTTFAEDPERCTNLSCGAARPRSGWGTLLGAGDELDRNYRIDRVLAVGGAGLTYLARELDPDGRPHAPELAIKVLYTQRDSGPFLRRLANEAQILQDLDHPHIVECRGFVHRAGRAPYLVTLFEHGGSLTDHVERVGPLSPVVAGGVLRQILLALDVAHQRGVVHRDLKPDNVLLHEQVDRDVIPQVRVADFGIAKTQGGGPALTRVGSFVGTPEYAAPEQFEGRAPTPATDVFAAGGLLVYLVTGRAPVRFSHRMDLAHCYDELLDQLPPQVDDPVLQDVLDHTMRADATERWTIRQVIARLDDLFAGGRATATAPLTDALPPDADEAGGTTFILGPEELAEPPPARPDDPSAHGTLLLTRDDAAEPPRPDAPPPTPRDAAPTRPPRGAVSEPPPRDAPPAALAPSAPTPTPPAAPAPADPDPNDLSLDDLFGGPSSSGPPTPAAPAPPRPAAPAAADPFADFFDAPPPDAEPDPFGDFFDAPPARQPRPAATRAPSQPPPAVSGAGCWAPSDPAPAPSALPSEPGALLRVLAAVDPEDRDPVVAALRDLDPSALGAVLRSHRAGGDPATGCGVALAIAALDRHDLANTARGLLSDASPDVRCCAAEALGAVGSGGLLAQLNRLLDDPVPRVRAVAARAIARACARTDQAALGRGWLSRLAGDRDTEVRDAYRLALTLLD